MLHNAQKVQIAKNNNWKHSTELPAWSWTQLCFSTLIVFGYNVIFFGHLIRPLLRFLRWYYWQVCCYWRQSLHCCCRRHHSRRYRHRHRSGLFDKTGVCFRVRCKDSYVCLHWRFHGRGGRCNKISGYRACHCSFQANSNWYCAHSVNGLMVLLSRNSKYRVHFIHILLLMLNFKRFTKCEARSGIFYSISLLQNIKLGRSCILVYVSLTWCLSAWRR